MTLTCGEAARGAGGVGMIKTHIESASKASIFGHRGVVTLSLPFFSSKL